jgi:hypothetical protein
MPEDTDRKASGFWTAVNAELKKAVEEGWSAFKESARIGKLRYRIHTLHKKAEGHFTEIGGMVYDMAKSPWENPLSRTEVREIIDEIRKIESETSALEEEIERLKKEKA